MATVADENAPLLEGRFGRPLAGKSRGLGGVGAKPGHTAGVGIKAKAGGHRHGRAILKDVTNSQNMRTVTSSSHDTAASCGASSTTASSSSVAPQASSGSGPSTSTTAKGHASSSSASTSTSARATASAGSSKSSIMFHGDFAIDLADRNNPLCCTEYVNDMYAHFRTVEVTRSPSSSYMERQTDITEKMRAILLDWLVEVHLKFRLEMRTLYLTVNIIDRFLEKVVVMRNKLQLVGVASMLLAAKYEEICPPPVADYVYLTDNAYTANEILECESKILNTLQFRLTVPTSWIFLSRYIRLAGLKDAKSILLARWFNERVLQEYSMLHYLPSKVASAAVFLTMVMRAKGAPVSWSSDMQRATGYTEAELLPCVRAIVAVAQVAPTSSLQAVRKKYKSEKYLQVARIPLPVQFMAHSPGGAGPGAGAGSARA